MYRTMKTNATGLNYIDNPSLASVLVFGQIFVSTT